MRLHLGRLNGEDITQRQLAQALGVKPQAYNSWEQGKTLPRLDHLWRLARYYRVSLDMLCGYERTADTTAGVEWESVRRPASEEDEQALELFHHALAGEMDDAADGAVSLAIRHVIYSQLIRITRAPRPDEQLGHALKECFNIGGKKRLKDVRAAWQPRNTCLST
jgi:transcriptional regulator with XRE-family HTH domain